MKVKGRAFPSPLQGATTETLEGGAGLPEVLLYLLTYLHLAPGVVRWVDTWGLALAVRRLRGQELGISPIVVDEGPRAQLRPPGEWPMMATFCAVRRAMVDLESRGCVARAQRRGNRPRWRLSDQEGTP